MLHFLDFGTTYTILDKIIDNTLCSTKVSNSKDKTLLKGVERLNMIKRPAKELALNINIYFSLVFLLLKTSVNMLKYSLQSEEHRYICIHGTNNQQGV